MMGFREAAKDCEAVNEQTRNFDDGQIRNVNYRIGIKDSNVGV